jgi:hypothetical protein
LGQRKISEKKMKITLSRLKQLIREELQKEVTLDGSPPPRPAKNQKAARKAIETVRTDVDGLIARLEDGIPPGPVQKAISKPLIDALDPIDDEILMQKVIKFRNDLHTIEQRRKGNAGILRQKWSQLQTAMLGMEAATGVAEGKLTDAEKTEKKKLKAKKSPTEKDEKRLKAIQHK